MWHEQWKGKSKVNIDVFVNVVVIRHLGATCSVFTTKFEHEQYKIEAVSRKWVWQVATMS